VLDGNVHRFGLEEGKLNMNSLSKKYSFGLMLLILAVLFVAATLLINSLFRGARIDLTQNREYTLSAGTKQILAKLDEPLDLSLYFSEKSSADFPQIRTYAQRVREMLDEMAQRSNGKIRLRNIDPEPFTDEEDRATELGLQSIPTGQGTDNLIFGLAGSNSTDQKVLIPFFDPSKETFLEYDIAKLILSLAKPEKTVVGLMSTLPMQGGFDNSTQQMSKPWVIVSQLQERYDVRAVGTDVKEIDPAINVLMVVHPKNLSDDTQYAIDQFVLRGGRLLAFVDPNSSQDRSGADPNNPAAAMMADHSSDLPKLFAAWGVQYSPKKVVGDAKYAAELSGGPNGEMIRNPVILDLRKEAMNQKEIISAQLERLFLDQSGAFKLAEKAPMTLEPILQTGDQAHLLDGDKTKFTQPSDLLTGADDKGETRVVAARLQGKLVSAFPDRASATGHLAASKDSANIVLFADADMLANDYWARVQEAFGQPIVTTFSDNGNLIVSAVDNLGGSGELISIRGRGNSMRPFTRVEAMKRVADDKFAQTQKQLEMQLKETESKLNALQQGKTAENAMILSPEQQAELKKFQDEKVRIRKELREVKRSLNVDIDRLGSWLKLLNIVILPGLVVALALAYSLHRRKQRRLAASEV
jgi:ABC-type uncharacterized transport system involved in gliding motility auxiliary subunit